MLKLYGMGSPNVVKALIMLEETKLPYSFSRVDVIAEEQFEKSFTELNPNSKVPVLVDERGEDKPPLVVFESGAILLYLAEKAGAFQPMDLEGRYELLQWLMFQMSALGPIGGQAIHFNFAVKDESYARNRFTNELNRLAGVLDTRLAEREWVVGHAYSIADIAMFPWVQTLRQFLPASIGLPNIERWFNQIAERPAVKAAVAFSAELSKQDMAAIRNATPEQRDRYFGRTPRPKAQ